MWLEGQNHFRLVLRKRKLVDISNPILEVTKKWLQAYFKGESPSPDDLPLAEQGTAFQQRVWLALSEIPMGQIRTYGQIGKAISCQSAQAVELLLVRIPG